MPDELTYQPNDLRRLREVLLPVLAKAAVGDFSNDVELVQDVAPQTRELLAGVQVLIETIREKEAELRLAEDKLAEAQIQTVDMLDKILSKSLRHPLD